MRPSVHAVPHWHVPLPAPRRKCRSHQSPPKATPSPARSQSPPSPCQHRQSCCRGGHSCPPRLPTVAVGPTRPRQLQHRLHHMLRLRTRHQHGRRHDQIQPPELLVPGDVLRRNAGRPARQSLVITLHLVGGELSLRMCIEICPIAIEREHGKEFGVHPRRANSRSGQPFDC